jgi:DNA-binding NarL/FixJ family response regulator
VNSDALDRGRRAFARRAWTDACTDLSAADADAPLHPEDLERLATASCLIGKLADSTDLWARAHRQFLSGGDVERAARCAFWLAFGLLHYGERTRAGAWVGRARRLLDENPRDCVEQGYLLLPAAFECLAAGDPARAHNMFCDAGEIGERFGNADLMALARHCRGRVLIMLGEIREGVVLLDEAMVAVDAGEVSPLVAGDVYCSVIEGCLEVFDFRRAQAWTAALTQWCQSQPDLLPYSGQCLVRRAEILQLHGVWLDAIEAAQRACDRFLEGPSQAAAGAAFYQRAELHRLRGEFGAAAEAYRHASRYGRSPQPGLAQLRLAQGQVDAAVAALRREADEVTNRAARCRLLPAYVEIMLAAQDVGAAHRGADELAAIAGALDSQVFHAVAAQARGAVLLAQGEARAALAVLRRAWRTWHELEAPYEAARARVLIALACRAMGDTDGAEMELDAARWVFQQLGARPDLDRVDALSLTSAPKAAGGLSAREIEVLRLVATGKTNRAIATELFISERTVERHVSNIFTKLDVSSRAAATAYAYEHQLISTS